MLGRITDKYIPKQALNGPNNPTYNAILMICDLMYGDQTSPA